MGFGPSQREKDALDAQASGSRAAGRKADSETRREEELFKQSKPQGNLLSEFFTGLLKGDRSVLTRLFAPQLEDSRRTAGQTRENILANIPSGGAQTAALAQTEQGVGADRGALLGGAPAQGASGLGNLFKTLLGGSAQFGSLGTGSLNAQTGGIGNVLQSEARRREAKLDFFGQLGGGLGAAAGGFLAGRGGGAG